MDFKCIAIRSNCFEKKKASRMSTSEQDIDSDQLDESPLLTHCISETIQREDDHSEPHLTSRNVWKNLLAICISFILIFTAFMSIQNLESTLNQQAGLGDASLACIYGGMMVSCFFAPLFITITSPKWGIVSGWITEIIFAASNFYPKFYTLIPASLLLGLGSGLIWTGQGVYITTLAEEYAEHLQEEPNVIINKFSGIFFFFFQNSQIWGNLISSLLLDRGNASSLDFTNSTHCGAHFCDLDTNTTGGASNHPSQKLVYILLGVLTGCVVLGLLVTLLFVDDRKKASREDVRPSMMQNVSSTFIAHFDIWILLMVPLFIWTGMEQAFLFGDFTEAFLSCQLGVSHVGFAMIGFGVADAVAAISVGRMEKWIGRTCLFIFAGAINLSLLIYMAVWRTYLGPKLLLYAIPVLWGVSDAIWQVITSAFIGVVYVDKREAAYATFNFWAAFGFVINFAYSHYICMDIKLYINIAVVCLAVVLYLVTEYGMRKIRNRAYIDLY